MASRTAVCDEGKEPKRQNSDGSSFFKKGHENNEIDDVTIKGSLLLIKYFFMISGQQVFVLEEPNEHQVFV